MRLFIRKGIGSITLLMGLCALLLVAFAIAVSPPEQALQYVGFGVLSGLLFISVGLMLFIVEDAQKPLVADR